MDYEAADDKPAYDKPAYDKPAYDNGAAARIAQVEAEWAQKKALDREVDDAIKARVRARKGNSSSVVFSVRLDRGEIAVLTRRAEVIGIPASALARNLIRAGVTAPARPGLSSALTELEDAVAKVRSLVP